MQAIFSANMMMKMTYTMMCMCHHYILQKGKYHN